jgi:cytochrome c553
MKRASSLFAKSVMTAALAIASVAHAATGAVPPAVEADAAKGQTLYNTGDAARNIAACITCHGPAGNATVPIYPKLSAQPYAYMVKQLHNFQTPERANAIMTPIAKAMTEQDIQNVSAYLTNQKAQPGAARNKETLELGKRIYRAGIPFKNIPACASCHLPNGAGMPAQYPRLAGQHQDYTTGELIAFRSGERKNSQQMTTIAGRMSDEEMKAVADYVAGLK